MFASLYYSIISKYDSFVIDFCFVYFVPIFFNFIVRVSVLLRHLLVYIKHFVSSTCFILFNLLADGMLSFCLTFVTVHDQIP